MHSTQWSALAACLIPHRWEDLRSTGKGLRIKQFKYFHLIVSKLKAERGEVAHPVHTTGKKINCSEVNALLSRLGLGFPNSQVSLITTTTHMTCVHVCMCVDVCVCVSPTGESSHCAFLRENSMLSVLSAIK